MQPDGLPAGGGRTLAAGSRGAAGTRGFLLVPETLRRPHVYHPAQLTEAASMASCFLQ